MSYEPCPKCGKPCGAKIEFVDRVYRRKFQLILCSTCKPSPDKIRPAWRRHRKRIASMTTG